MAYKIDTEQCLKCALCVGKCPEKAIIAVKKVQVDELVLQLVGIDEAKCNDCGVCQSEEYWCPAQAIKKA
jgi:NAD-dependent dihydropyrimidine dehydrogenase PreA subunit